MSLPRYRFVGIEAAAFVRVCHSPSGVEHRYFLGDKYQKNVMLFSFLLRECGLSMDDACIAMNWVDDAKIGDSISFPHVSLVGVPYSKTSDNAPGGVKARASGSV
mgnify:CR=1 FL=1